MEEKSKTKICNVCHLGIDESKEFVRNTHFKDKGEIFSEGYYHIECFRSRVLGKGQLEKIQGQANRLLNFAKEKLGMEETTEVVEI